MTRRLLPLLAVVLLALPAVPRAQDKADDKPAAPAGTWKIMLPWTENAGTQALWLVKLQKKDDKWTGSVQATAPRWFRPTLENLTVGKETLRFTLKSPRETLRCEVTIADARADKLRGSVVVGRSVLPMEMERTTLTSLDPYDVGKEALAKLPLGQEAVMQALQLLGQAEAKKAKPEEVRGWAEKAIKGAGLHGATWQREILLTVARILSEESGYEAIALPYARRAERLLGDKDPPAVQKRVLDVLAAALEKAGKPDEAKKVQTRIAKLDFRIKPKPFAGRKGKSDRVVLVELFTGAQCPPCVAADLAFDALGKTFKPSEVVLLQYHVHVPQPDPLTSPDSEARMKFYDEAVQSRAPTMLFNGQPAARGGGTMSDAGEKYEEYLGVIEPLLEAASKGQIKLSATRAGDKVEIKAEVSNLAQTGDDVRLRLALVEEEVSYKGTNGVPRHHQVVRAMPGGDEGTVMKDKTAKKTVTVDLAKLKKDLTAYLDDYAKKRPFPHKDRPLELKKLRVIAFVQNDKSGEVLQAAQVEVKGAE
jgi:hypothetical protein